MSLRKNSYAVPWKLFVPDRVMIDDHAASRASGLGRVAVRLDGDLLDAFHDWLDAGGADDALVVVDAVDDGVVQGVVLAVDGEAARGPAIVRTAAAGQTISRAFIRAWDKLHQLHIVTSVQRQILHRLRGDGRADGGVVGLQQWRRGLDVDGLRSRRR